MAREITDIKKKRKTMPKEVKVLKDAILGNWWFYILTAISVVLLIASWICPPTAVIDASVLGGIAELFAFAALGTVIKAIDNGRTASITHNDTTIEIGKKEE